MTQRDMIISTPSSDEGLGAYISQINKFDMLTPEQEVKLAHEMHENKSIEAAHKLITSHLRLVVSVALKFKGYGLPIMDLIAEGNIGLMRAVKKFDASKGHRLSTYALWWIRAFIQEYILKSWSLVKIGTTSAQKKLFFSLKKLKRKLEIHTDSDLNPENVQKIATNLNVANQEVIDMNRRLGGHDASLNAPLALGQETYTERQDMLADQSPSQEIILAQKDEQAHYQKLMTRALKEMPDRDRDIIVRRRIDEPPATLEVLSQEYGISRERVRQIEDRAFKNLKKRVLSLANPHIPHQISYHPST